MDAPVHVAADVMPETRASSLVVEFELRPDPLVH
jgi:hypothetical protein